MRFKFFVLFILTSFFGLQASANAQSLAALSFDDRESIESACYVPKVTQGPAAYHTCLDKQLGELKQFEALSPTLRSAAVAPANLKHIPHASLSAPVASTTAFPALKPGTSSIPASPPTTVACAENGSCYGDISDRTGLPKTAAVQGYYRANGTYVRGYYRSHK